MGKAPASQFYWGDLRRDTEYHLMSWSSRGIWIEMLSCMHFSKERGKLEGTPEQLSRLIGCTVEEFEKSSDDINVTKTGDVTKCNGIVTIINRRMFREEKAKSSHALRQERYRDRHKSDSKVTPPSSSSSPSPTSLNKIITQLFEKFWSIYPSRNGRKVTKKESLQFFKNNFKDETEINLLLKATENYSKSEDVQKGYAKDPIRFLKKDFWRDWVEKEIQEDPYSNFPRIGGKENGSQN